MRNSPSKKSKSKQTKSKADSSAATPDDVRGRSTSKKVEDGHLARLGALIKERRRDRFTIEALAAEAGLSAGLISQVERGIGNPSFATLVRLSYALGFPLSEVFEGPEFDERQMVTRRDERRRLVIPADGTTHEILVPASDHKLGLMSSTFPPGFSSTSSPNSHLGEEIVLVLTGTLLGTVGGQQFTLQEGDTLIFDSASPHAWENASDAPTTVLFVSTPPASNIAH